MEESLRATEQALAESEITVLEAESSRKEQEVRVAKLATERLFTRERAHRAAQNRDEAKRAVAAPRPGRWLRAAAVVLAAVATGAGFYAFTRMPQPETPVVATGGPLMLRIDSNVNAIPARD